MPFVVGVARWPADGDTDRLVQTVEGGASARVEHPFPVTLELGDS